MGGPGRHRARAVRLHRIYGTASALVFSKVFFPNISPSAGLIASFATYAIGFLRPPARRPVLLPLRREVRPQVGSGHHAVPDGRGDVPDRLPAHLRLHRHLGAAAARRSAVPARLRRRRRAGRRRHAADRDRTHRPARPARRPSSWSAPHSAPSLGALAWVLVQLLPDEAVQQLGVASDLLGQHVRHHRRLHHPDEDGRKPDLRGAQEVRRRRARSPAEGRRQVRHEERRSRSSS